MTAHLFLVPAGSLDGVTAGDTVALAGAEARHAAGSMRLGPGDPILVADGTGSRVGGTVATAAADRVEVRVGHLCPEDVGAPELVLVQALAKGDRDLIAVQAATELGVGRVVPWEAQRSIVRWKGPREDKARQKWTDALASAAKQARRGVVPALGERLSGTGAARLAGPDTLLLVLHEDAETALSSVGQRDLEAAARVAVVVGPEGGITREELDAFAAAGAVAVRLGPHVMRSSTAGPAALAVLQSRLGRF